MVKYGVIDSGKGGQHIGQLLTEIFNAEVVIWRPPFFRSYSNMSIDNLKAQVDVHLNYLHQNKVDVIIVGCMTLSTNLLDYIKSQTELPVYDLYTNLPKFDVHTLCIATFNSINSGKFRDYLELPCPDLSKAIEEGCPILIPGLLRGYETQLKRVHSTNKILLGCSHYSIHKDIFQEYYDRCIIIDPVDYLIKSLKNLDEKIYVNDSRLLSYS